MQNVADVVEALSAFGEGAQPGMRFKAAEAALWCDDVAVEAGDAERAAIEECCRLRRSPSTRWCGFPD